MAGQCWGSPGSTPAEEVAIIDTINTKKMDLPVISDPAEETPEVEDRNDVVEEAPAANSINPTRSSCLRIQDGSR